MHPELLNNSIFLRYYNQWQEDPTSIVFAPIAEYLQIYGMLDEAIKVCLEGLKNHPDLVSGRLALAKAYVRKMDFEKAREELRRVLILMPDQEKALELMAQVDKELSPTPKTKQPIGWETVTMAKIYASQGHLHKAREVYQAILQRPGARNWWWHR